MQFVQDDFAVFAKPNRLHVHPNCSKHGVIRVSYGQTWKINGNPKLLNLTIVKNGTIEYGRYPDAQQQLWSSLHSHRGKYLIVTAKKGYQFGNENEPEHNEGAQQASLVKDDVVAPMIVVGTDKVPRKPTRLVDLKEYFISLMNSEVPQPMQTK